MSTATWFMNTLARVLLDAAATDGAWDLVEVLTPPGHRPPPHVHGAHGEGWAVLEGEITLHTAAGSRVVRAGEAAFSPAGEAHSLEVTSAGPTRMLVSSVPAGFAAFVQDLGVPAEREELPPPAKPDLARVAEVSRRHGITVLDALPQLL